MVASCRCQSQVARATPCHGARGDSAARSGHQPHGRVFHLNQRVAVLQVKRLVEYATHMKKISSAGVHINDIINACYEARAYITDKGLPGQQDLVQAPNFNLPKNLAVMPAFGVGFAVGLVVWARLVGFPWWPAVVVDRKEHPEMETGGTLPIAAESSRVVELFKDTHTARLRGGS